MIADVRKAHIQRATHQLLLARLMKTTTFRGRHRSDKFNKVKDNQPGFLDTSHTYSHISDTATDATTATNLTFRTIPGASFLDTSRTKSTLVK